MMVEIIDFSKRYEKDCIFKDFNLSLEENQITCILGNSGSGKTTLLNAISNLTDYEGKISSSKDISYVFQDERLIRPLTIKKNVEIVLDNLDKKEREKIALEFLDKVELKGDCNKKPRELSGGMNQRVSIARAFAKKSKLLLMDEPFKALDISLKKRIIDTFINLWLEDKRTCVFVTHSIDEALLLSHRIIVLGDRPAKVIGDLNVDKEIVYRDLNEDYFLNLRKQVYAILTK